MLLGFAFYVVAFLCALLAIEGLLTALSVPSYARGAQLSEAAAAWSRVALGAGGAMSALFAGYVCQTLAEIARLLRSTHDAAPAGFQPDDTGRALRRDPAFDGDWNEERGR